MVTTAVTVFALMAMRGPLACVPNAMTRLAALALLAGDCASRVAVHRLAHVRRYRCRVRPSRYPAPMTLPVTMPIRTGIRVAPSSRGRARPGFAAVASGTVPGRTVFGSVATSCRSFAVAAPSRRVLRRRLLPSQSRPIPTLYALAGAVSVTPERSPLRACSRRALVMPSRAFSTTWNVRRMPDRVYSLRIHGSGRIPVGAGLRLPWKAISLNAPDCHPYDGVFR